MISYLSRRPNPTPYYLFDGTTLLLWGKARVVRAVETSAPEWIVMVDRGASSGGGRKLGPDAIAGLFGWMKKNYRPVWQEGAPFTGDPRFGVALLRRETPVER